MNSEVVTEIYQHVHLLGCTKRRSKPQLKHDNDQKGPTPPSPQQHLELERPVTKTVSQLHQEQHLWMKKY